MRRTARRVCARSVARDAHSRERVRDKTDDLRTARFLLSLFGGSRGAVFFVIVVRPASSRWRLCGRFTPSIVPFTCLCCVPPALSYSSPLDDAQRRRLSTSRSHVDKGLTYCVLFCFFWSPGTVAPTVELTLARRHCWRRRGKKGGRSATITGHGWGSQQLSTRRVF